MVFGSGKEETTIIHNIIYILDNSKHVLKLYKLFNLNAYLQVVNTHFNLNHLRHNIYRKL